MAENAMCVCEYCDSYVPITLCLPDGKKIPEKSFSST